MKSKVLVIYTGGTIGMFKDEATGGLRPFDFEQMIEFIPELKRFYLQLDTISFEPVDSATITPELWIKLTKTVEKNYYNYDGFVILHGTDTMAYSASALSFMIENLQKPIIFTGSQLPIGQLRTDGKENLIASVEIAAAKKNGKSLVPEVCIFFQNKLYRGNRSHKYNAQYFDAFESPNYPPLAEVGIEIKFNKNFISRPVANRPVRFIKKLETNVAILKLFPGISTNLVDSIIETEGLKGLIIETYGAGNAPLSKDFWKVIKKTVDKKILTINVTQCNAGKVEQGLYSTSRKFSEYGIVSGKDITTEAAISKLMFLLGQNFDFETLKFYASKNIAGEMSD